MTDSQRATAAPPRKSRSGSNTRRRTQQVKLNLLPHEEMALQKAADESGFKGSLPAFILHKLAPVLASAS